MVVKAQMMEVFPSAGAVGTASPACGDRRTSFACSACWRACCGMPGGEEGRIEKEEKGGRGGGRRGRGEEGEFTAKQLIMVKL